MNEDTKFFEFAAVYNTMLGRDPEASRLRIFLRDENLEIARRLDQFVATNDLLFYLQGPPGVGKTKESILWMLQSVAKGSGAEDSNAPWAWIPLTKSGGTGVVNEVYLLDRSGTASNPVRYRVIHTSNLATDLCNWGVKVVVFDNGNQGNRGPIDDCLVMKLKTIAVSSLQMKFDDSFSRQQSYTVSGWKEAEYLEACKDDIFFNSIKATLQTGDFTEEELNDPTTRSEVVAAKYHLAGGCARWMFQYSVEQLLSPAGVIQSIDNHVDRVSYHQVIAGFIGDRSITEVNHLLSRIDNRAVIVSQYVANQLVLRFGEALLRQALLLLGDSNPAMDGVLMEMDFILRLGRSTSEQKVSIDLVIELGADPVPLLQSGGKKIKFRFSTFDTEVFTVADEDWFIPKIFNNGGFDCVQYRMGKLIFVQITRSGTHSFNLKWYQKFHDAFVKTFPALEVAECEVWFIVQEGLVDIFAPDAPTGNLTGFRKDSFKVAGMRRIRA